MKNIEIDYRSNKTKYEKTLHFWVKMVKKTKRKIAFWGIVELDKKLNIPNQWFDAGVFIYDCLLSSLNGTDLDAFLSVPLSLTDKATNIEALNYLYVKNEVFTEEPPTLFLHPVERNAFEKSQLAFIENLSNELCKPVYFEEQRLDNGIYMRRIVVCKSNSEK